MSGRPLGDCAWRFDRPKGLSARALDEALRREPGVRDVVVTEDHVAVDFDPSAPPPSLEDLVERLVRDEVPEPAHGAAHVVAVRYDGEDLASVAAAVGLSVEAVVSLHTARVYEVCLIGFLPGFAYLSGLDPKLALPRKPTPRPRVPAGAVAIATTYSAVYPFASPGGWHLIGTALDFVPMSLVLGDRVRFEVLL